MKKIIYISVFVLSSKSFLAQIAPATGSTIVTPTVIATGNAIFGQNNAINQSGTTSSIAIGTSNTILNNTNASFGTGYNNYFGGTQTSVFGANNTNFGAQNLVTGNSNFMNGAQNAIIGYGNIINSASTTPTLGKTTSGCLVSGINNQVAYNSAGTATNHETTCSNVFGGFSAVSGQYNYAIGLRALAGITSYTATTTTTISNAFALGMNVTAGANGAMVIGSGLWSGSNTSHNKDVINNTPNSLMISFNKQSTTIAPDNNRPTLFISEADQTLPLSNYAKYGTVGIGTNDTKGHTLGVRGDIIAEKIQVALYSGGWPDYVFNKDYKLSPIKKLEEYIQQNNHLPNLPCAKEIEQNGYDLANMDAKLLEKIEELTLYLIEMNKQLETLKKENELLKLKLR